MVSNPCLFLLWSEHWKHFKILSLYQSYIVCSKEFELKILYLNHTCIQCYLRIRGVQNTVATNKIGTKLFFKYIFEGTNSVDWCLSRFRRSPQLSRDYCAHTVNVSFLYTWCWKSRACFSRSGYSGLLGLVNAGLLLVVKRHVPSDKHYAFFWPPVQSQIYGYFIIAKRGILWGVNELEPYNNYCT